MPAVTAPHHAVAHYENFPVASWLMPARLRPAVVALYRFAREADDLADEGEAEPAERLAALTRLRQGIGAARRGLEIDVPVVASLAPHVEAHQLDWGLFEQLLSAFEQDVVHAPYRTRSELLDYCSRSAAPVGRLILGLFGLSGAERGQQSDAICTALQLINFLQDLGTDVARGRHYLPLESLRAEGLGHEDVESACREGRADERLRRVLAAEAGLARERLHAGLGLIAQVPRRLAWELGAIVTGGGRILDLLARQGYDPLVRRPRLRWQDAPALATGTLSRALGAHRK